MTVDKVLEERGKRYGEFKDHADICQGLKSVMTEATGWKRLSNSQKQALEVIADKIARMLNGDPNYDDNWVDISGYATLIVNELQDRPNQGLEPENIPVHSNQGMLDLSDDSKYTHMDGFEPVCKPDTVCEPEPICEECEPEPICEEWENKRKYDSKGTVRPERKKARPELYKDKHV